MTTTTVSKTLNVLREWFSVHGIPEQIVMDNGPQFIVADLQMQWNQTCEECTISPSFEWVSRKVCPVTETEFESIC